MNSKEACIKIKSIEAKYYLKFKFGNLNYWPLFRLILWNNLTSIKKKKKIKKNNIFLLIKNIIKWFYFNINNYSFFENRSNLKYFFFSKKTALSHIYKNNLIYDRVLDPVIDSIKSKNLKKIYLESFFIKKNNLAFPVSKINISQEFILKKFLIPNHVIKNIYKISKISNLNKDIILSNFDDELQNLNTWYKFGDKIFKRYKNLKYIYVYPWYSSTVMGLIAASKKFKIKSFDVQHGIQGEYQAMYTDWSRIPPEGYEMLPDIFLSWDKRTIKNHYLRSHDLLRNNHKSVIHKDTWLNYYNKKLIIKNDRFINKTLLFCMQPLTASNKEIIPNFLLEYIKSNKSKDTNFIFRAHPNDKKSFKKAKKILLEYTKKRKISYDYAKNSVFDVFSEVTHCMTAFSSTSVEGYKFGLESAVFGKDAVKTLNYYIKNKKIKLLKKNKQSLAKWLN